MVGTPHLYAFGAYADSMGNNAERNCPLHRPGNSSDKKWPEAALTSTSTDHPRATAKQLHMYDSIGTSMDAAGIGGWMEKGMGV